MPTKIVTFSNPVLISIQMKKKEEFLYSEIETALRNDLWKKKITGIYFRWLESFVICLESVKSTKIYLCNSIFFYE